jgi:hypothetical protein
MAAAPHAHCLDEMIADLHVTGLAGWFRVRLDQLADPTPPVPPALLPLIVRNKPTMDGSPASSRPWVNSISAATTKPRRAR